MIALQCGVVSAVQQRGSYIHISPPPEPPSTLIPPSGSSQSPELSSPSTQQLPTISHIVVCTRQVSLTPSCPVIGSPSHLDRNPKPKGQHEGCDPGLVSRGEEPTRAPLPRCALGPCTTLPPSPLWAASAGLGFVLRRLVGDRFDRLPSV